MGWFSTKRALLSGKPQLIRSVFLHEVDPKRSMMVAMSHMTPEEARQASANLAAYEEWRKRDYAKDIVSVERFLGI